MINNILNFTVKIFLPPRLARPVSLSLFSSSIYKRPKKRENNGIHIKIIKPIQDKLLVFFLYSKLNISNKIILFPTIIPTHHDI